MATRVLVVGATGHVGEKVVRRLAERKSEFDVRALVREGSDASKLEAQGVRVVRGDYVRGGPPRAARRRKEITD